MQSGPLVQDLTPSIPSRDSFYPVESSSAEQTSSFIDTSSTAQYNGTMSIARIRPWWTLEAIQNTSALSRAPRTRNCSVQSCPFTTKRGITYSSTRSQPLNNGKSAATATTAAATTNSPSSSSTQIPRSTPPTSSSTPSSTTSQASRVAAGTPNRPTTENISKSGLADKPLELESAPEEKIDWTRSFHGLSAEPFPKEAADILLAETAPEEVEIKPDGIVYLPEIKYRRILNKAFGPGGWGLVPRSESIVTPRTVTREYALVCHGR